MPPGRRARAGRWPRPQRAAEPPSQPAEDRRGGAYAQVTAPPRRGRLSRPVTPNSQHPSSFCQRSRSGARAAQKLHRRPLLAVHPRTARSPREAHSAAALHARSAPTALEGVGGSAAVMLPVVYAVLAGLLMLPLLVNLCCPYFFQDLRYFLLVAGVAQRARSNGKRRPVRTILYAFLEKVQQTPHQPFLLFRDETLTYAQVDRRSNQVARALRDHLGLRQGDCVAIFMGNEPAYIWLWLGLIKLGCAMACLNYNIRGKSLLHCFQCSGAKVLLVSPGEPGDHLTLALGSFSS